MGISASSTHFWSILGFKSPKITCNYLVEPSGLEFILNDELVNPQANPALAKLEGVAEGTFQLL